MNKTAIKNYAIWARVQLIESCKQRAFEYGVTEDGNYASNLRTIGSRILTDQEVEQRNQLISQIQQKGYAQVMEEAAYTWFNRFIALRFMEVNGYLPSKVRVFTDENGAFKPEILKEAMTVDLEGIDRAVVIDLLEKQDNEALYKYLLITQCNALSTGLPYMFEKISNWTELLFPANLLRTDSVVEAMVTDIPEEDWTDAVQIIGWLYQYYNSELKDETFALLKKNVKITKERIPAATQLFTPDWIVRYMVENSLGRLWYEGHKDFDKSQWKYYLDEAEQEPEVEAELIKIRAEYSQIKPEKIKVIDPCMGSGHILVYAFDVLMQIYTSAGWSERDAAKSILENNLYGLDIDDRAGQLAYFAVMMKARKYSRRIMSLDIKPNVMSIQDSSFMTNELIDFVAGNDSTIKADLRRIKEVFTDAKEYGSILNVPSLGYAAILDRISDIQADFVKDVFQVEYKDIALENLLPLIKQAMIMSQKYDVVVTNPPYMGINNASAKLNSFAKDQFPISRFDLSTIFMEKTLDLCKHTGLMAMINIPVWMSKSSFEDFRYGLINNHTFINMLHNGRGIFGSDFGTTTFVFLNACIERYSATFHQLFDEMGAVDSVEQKEKWFFEGKGRYITEQARFKKIASYPIAYSTSKKLLKILDEEKPLEYYAYPRKGLTTGDNDTFVRLWHEIDITKFSMTKGTGKWFPMTKGGDFRRWYGNNDYCVNWENDGYEIKNFKDDNGKLRSRPQNTQFYFREGISWNDTTATGKIAFRYQPEGYISNASGPCVFADKDLKYLFGMLNSIVSQKLLEILAPNMKFEVGQMALVPIIMKANQQIDAIVLRLIQLAMADWDSFETSWDFKKHPLI